MTQYYKMTTARWERLCNLAGMQAYENTSFPKIRDYIQLRYNGKLMRTWDGECIRFKTEADCTWFLIQVS